MVQTSFLTLFLKELMCKVREFDLYFTTVKIDEWVGCIDKWHSSHPYANCYPIFMEMIEQIISPLTKNSNKLITIFENEINFKQFSRLLNYNESLLNLNDSWENHIHRRAVIDFLIESFENVSHYSEF